MNGAGILLILLLLQFGFTALLIRMASGKWSILSQPTSWLYSCWILGLILLSLPLYRYEEAVTLNSGGLMMATLLAFSIGAVAQEFYQINNNKKTEQISGANIAPIIKFALTAGTIGGALLILNAYLGGGITLAERLDGTNAALIRELHMAGGASKIGPLFGPASTAYNIGFGALIIFCAAKGFGSKSDAIVSRYTHAVAASFATISVIFSIFFAGGRITIVILILMAAMGYYGGLRARKRHQAKAVKNKRWSVRIFLTLFATTTLSWGLWYSSTSFLENRTAAAEPETLLFTTHRARFSPEAEVLATHSKDVGYALFTLSYISTPIPTYLYYLDLPSTRVVELQWGQYSFPIIARYAMRLSGQFDPTYWSEARTQVFRPLAEMNLGENVWATLNRDLLVDFGKVGSIMFMLALGFLCQMVHNNNLKSEHYDWVAVSTLTKLLLLFSGLTSLLYMNQFSWPLYFCLGIIFYCRYKKSRTPSAAASQKASKP